jgi:hypothetical protein
VITVVQESSRMTLADLEALQKSGEFHHATYRCQGTLWEGLWVYRRSETGFRGYDVVGSFPVGAPELAQAMRACTGVSVGAYGQG